MSSFLHTDALNHIEQYLASCKTRYLRDNGGRPAYPSLSMRPCKTP